MRIKSMLSQSRRDFVAMFECEHCGYSVRKSGYDDANFHNNVIPKIACEKCGKTAADDYVPLTPRYPEGLQL